PLLPPVQTAQPIPQLLLGIGVHEIPAIAGPDQDVLVAVEIDVEEHGRPAPPGGIDSGQLGDLSKGAVAPVQEKRVALDLGPVGKDARSLRKRGVSWDLRLERTSVAAQHVDLEQIDVAVPVDVAEIEGHCRIAGGPLDQRPGETEVAVTIV